MEIGMNDGTTDTQTRDDIEKTRPGIEPGISEMKE